MVAVMKLVLCWMVLTMLGFRLAVSPGDGKDDRIHGSTCSVDGDDVQQVHSARNIGGYSFFAAWPSCSVSVNCILCCFI